VLGIVAETETIVVGKAVVLDVKVVGTTIPEVTAEATALEETTEMTLLLAPAMSDNKATVVETENFIMRLALSGIL
jgi:hypothetical protein